MALSGPAWPCVRDHIEGVILSVKVTPNASKTEPKGLWKEKLHVRLQVPAVEGKANAALIRWVGATFGLRPRQVEIVAGHKAREKKLLLRGLAIGSALKALDRLLDR